MENYWKFLTTQIESEYKNLYKITKNNKTKNETCYMNHEWDV